MQIKTKDKIVQAVLRKMDDRSLVGQKKYGQTMQDEIETGKRCLTDEIEEAMTNRMNIIGQNGNDGLHYIDVNDEEEI